jgi:hypothetical protein
MTASDVFHHLALMAKANYSDSRLEALHNFVSRAVKLDAVKTIEILLDGSSRF